MLSSLFQALPKQTPDHQYGVQIFDAKIAEDREKLMAILTAQPRPIVYDTLRDQLFELFAIEEPQVRLTSSDLENRLERYQGIIPWDQVGLWIYYPWSGRLLHCLPPHEFMKVRTNRNKNKLTEAEQQSLSQKKIGIIGLSVGQSAALALSLERGFGEIRIADFDCLSLSNLNRLRAGIHEIGFNKAVLTARAIAELDPYLKVVPFLEGITEDNMESFLLEGGSLDLVVDECDSLSIKALIRLSAREHRIPVIMETSDRGLIDIERFDYEPQREIFHGRVKVEDASQLRNLTNEQKVPYVFQIIGEETISDKMVASMLEIDQTICSWPQLGADVTLGGALVAHVSREILLARGPASGRHWIDLHELIGKAGSSQVLECGSSDSSQPQGSQSARKALRLTGPWSTLIHAASRAPSGGNMQPWLWTIKDNVGELYLDPQHLGNLLDFEHTASLVSAGAALENIVVQATSLDVALHVELLPDESFKENLSVARILLDGQGASQPLDLILWERCKGWRDLGPFISQRHTNRRIESAREPIAGTVLDALMQVVTEVEGAHCHFLSDPEDLKQIADIVGEADRLRFLSERLHRELMAEIRWSEVEVQSSCDGIDMETLELSEADQIGIRLCRSWSVMDNVRLLGGGTGLKKSARKAISSAGAVGLIWMDGHQPIDFLRGGAVMQRLWLKATELGLGFQPLSALTYLFARFLRSPESLEPDQLAVLASLRPRYERLFPVANESGDILLFRLSADPSPVRKKSLRRPPSC